ncbi:helix-turn-helix domain-containing protein [Ligilactobacillus cholophilus]|uniref:helix-turn-helix domain-containing protein n=1 Tax=Ligilactobacillus cholophilus TaxID=3050131 RepID=UPI0025B216C9|nr:RodZ domain-containing protein [Ligilactobacillus cholophilus]
MSGVGQKLKDARIAKGLTLDDLQQSTKIQKRYLIAIEEGNYQALPGDFYVRAFARQYAETVGLDPNEIVKEIDSELGTKSSESNENDETSRTQKREQINKPEENSTSAKLAKYLPTIIIVVIVVAILGTVYAVAWGNHEKAKNRQIEETSTKVAVSTDVKSKKKKASSTQKQSSSSESSESKKQKIVSAGSSGSTFTYNVENAATTNELKLSATTGSSWDAVYIDGTQTWQGTLQQGSDHTIKIPEGTSSVTINIGNSKASAVKINDSDLNFLEQNSSLTVRKLVINFGNNNSQTSSTTQTTTNAYSNN